MSIKRNIQWMADCDFKNELSAADRAWYEKFESEYYDANVYETENLHNTRSLKKSVTDANNARNRDLYGIKSCGGAIDKAGILPDICSYHPGSVEDAVIAMIDASNSDNN